MSTTGDLHSIPLWVSFFGGMAPLASIVVFLAPLPTIRKIQRDKSVGTLPLLPYSSMVASTFLWLAYGVLKGEPKIYGSNLFGLACGAYYSWAFLRYSPKASPTLPGSVTQHAQACGWIMLLTCLMASAHGRLPSAVDWIGRAGVVFCVAMFASPLAAIRTVVETRSAASIPAPFTAACVVNCVAWTVWGWFAMHDSNIYVPNGLGLTFGLLQLGLKVHYGSNGGKGMPSGSKHLEMASMLPK
jgi:solute carrier family 50 (sugar transporter)